MRCSHCGICCTETEMPLSKADIKLLESAGQNREKFLWFVKQGYVQLLNCRGHCVFYHPQKQRCRVYRHRPLGCRIYPVIYNEKEGVVVDDLCPRAFTVSDTERKSKAQGLRRLLKRIDAEAKQRSPSI
jgi:Fe-S-cluster containining protein